MAFVIDELCFRAELIQRARFAEFQIHSFRIELTEGLLAKATVVPIVVEPNIANGPGVFFGHEFTNGFGGWQ